VELNFSEPLPGSTTVTDDFDGEKMTLALVKA
jgi:hypothetical protein